MNWDKYNILISKKELDLLDSYLFDGQKCKHEYLSVDTETNGLHFWKNVVIGFSLSVNDHSGFYIPLLEWIPTGSEKKKKLNKKEYLVKETGFFRCIWSGQQFKEDVSPKQYNPPEFIKNYVKKWFVNSNLIMHNAPFDVLMIESSFGVNLEDNVFCDTALLKHVLDETTSSGLKQTALQWQNLLNTDISRQENKEQEEMGKSVIKNGGKFNKTSKHIWRASLDVLGKYAVADTFLTFSIFKIGIEKLINLGKKENNDYDHKYVKWFFEDEIMPLCKEVVINMKRKGVRIDVSYFLELEKETREKMESLEDQVLALIGSDILDFPIGKSIDDEVPQRAIVEEIIKLEDLPYPELKGKKSLSKQAIKKINNEEPHWLWGYILGEDEIKYSDEKIEKIKKSIYRKRIGRRYRFNIGSDAHLRWLFCSKYGIDKQSLPQTDAATKDNPIPSMKADVLKEHLLGKYKFVKYLLLWKKLRKLHTTYILPALELNNNGYLHMDLMQNGTTSGRFACRGGFNLQTLPQVEELDKCPNCGSKPVVEYPVKLVANIKCEECEYKEEGIICPSAIKEGFIAPEGMNIVNADYSSLEPRTFAFMSGDPGLKEIYWSNLDMYSKIYCDMEDHEGKYSPDPKDENFLKKKAKHLRDMIKPVVLGIPYGARGPQTANLMGFKTKTIDRSGNVRETLDVDKGIYFREKYLNTYPKLREYMESQEIKAVTQGFVESLVGRRRHFKFAVPVYKLINKAGKDIDWFLDTPKKDLEVQELDSVFTQKELENVLKIAGVKFFDEKGEKRTWAFVKALFKNELNNCKNFPIQAMGAHITNKGMLDTARRIKKEGLDAYVCLQVHDEITCYASENDTDHFKMVLKESMENNDYAKMLDIDMIADPIVAKTLKEAK